MLTNRELARIEPRALVHRVFRDFDRFFDEGWLPFKPAARLIGEFPFVPALEVAEKDHNLVARFDLPGIKKEEVTISFTAEGLVVEGERKQEEEEKKHDWYRTERSYGKFVRTIPLPEGVMASDIKATFDNGVLEIIVPLPAAAVAATPRKIEIGGVEKKTAKTAA